MLFYSSLMCAKCTDECVDKKHTKDARNVVPSIKTSDLENKPKQAMYKENRTQEKKKSVSQFVCFFFFSLKLLLQFQ